MPSVIIPGRAAKGQRPSGPYRLNRASPQFVGLSERIAGEYFAPTLTGRSITYVGTFDNLGTGRPGPVSGVFPQYNQSGGNTGSAYVETPQLTDSMPLTVSFWWYSPQDPTASRYAFEISGGSWSLRTIFQGTSGNTFQGSVVTTSGGAAQYDTSGAVRAFSTGNQWIHYTLVWHPGTGLFQYVNGVLDGSNTTTTTGLRSVSRLTFYGSGANTALEGSLVDIRLYTRALTAAQAWSLYDPATRWDLHWVPGRRVFFDVGAAPAGGNRRRRVICGATA